MLRLLILMLGLSIVCSGQTTFKSAQVTGNIAVTNGQTFLFSDTFDRSGAVIGAWTQVQDTTDNTLVADPGGAFGQTNVLRIHYIVNNNDYNRWLGEDFTPSLTHFGFIEKVMQATCNSGTTPTCTNDGQRKIIYNKSATADCPTLIHITQDVIGSASPQPITVDTGGTIFSGGNASIAPFGAGAAVETFAVTAATSGSVTGVITQNHANGDQIWLVGDHQRTCYAVVLTSDSVDGSHIQLQYSLARGNNTAALNCYALGSGAALLFNTVYILEGEVYLGTPGVQDGFVRLWVNGVENTTWSGAACISASNPVPSTAVKLRDVAYNGAITPTGIQRIENGDQWSPDTANKQADEYRYLARFGICSGGRCQNLP